MRISSRSVTLSWTLPEENQRNGLIVGYMVVCTGEDSTMSFTLETFNFTATVEDLSPYVLYMCSITASTSAGAGPAADLNFTTATEGKQLVV